MAQNPRKKSAVDPAVPAKKSSSAATPKPNEAKTLPKATIEIGAGPTTKRTTSKTAPSATPTEDVVLVHGRTEDGALQVIRKKGDELSAGELRPIEEGKPIRGKLLKLRPREEMPLLADVEEEIAITSPNLSGRLSGPAQVATDSYRKGWDGLWGARKKRSAAN